MILIPATLEGFRGLKDRSFKLSFETQELSPDDLHEITLANGNFGYLAFKKEPFQEEEKNLIEDLKTDYTDSGKSPSQRMTHVLYKIWESTPEGYKTFSDYYRAKMEVLINHLKTKI